MAQPNNTANNNSGILNTVGDWIGLDGQFGTGGSNNSYSIGGLADSFGNLFSSGTSTVPNTYTYGSADEAAKAFSDFNSDFMDGFGAKPSLSADGTTVTLGNSTPNTGLAGTLAGAKSIFDIGSSLFGMYNTNKMTNAAIDNYKNMQRIANANEARTQEQYDTFKADKAALNASYGG